MIKYLLPFLLISLGGCNWEQPREQIIIESLEQKIDSLNLVVSPDDILPLADSLLKLDSKNYKALSVVGINAFNNGNTETAIDYLTKTVKLRPEFPMNSVLLGLSYEDQNEMDSAYKYYQHAISIDSVDWPASWIRIQLSTILKGKEFGIELLKENKDSLNQLLCLQLANDIEIYDGQGLIDFFPQLLEPKDGSKFYISIPSDLYNNGHLNSMDKVELMFAKLGINVTCKSTDFRNKGYTIWTNDNYSERLIALDTLKIKKL